MNILRIDSSARHDGSISRKLLDDVAARLGGPVTTRDLATEPLPQITGTWMGANFTPEADRTDEQRAALAQSDALIAELKAADTILIGAPIYNFSIPAALKAWIDLVARAGVTFRYTENGPEGLLEGKRAIIAIASGGTEVGSEIDFASGYLRHVLGFIGITDVEFVAADRLMIDADASMSKAGDQIGALAA
ncbi:FMN-dependent NADH-azoreductase [Jannaschia aquimarina]|uniref:FMN dependent NADH:quinone oxidoreductase n=1 Tax=Jannaschia aquimarina TaxID=935700 RepID=A0A0D1EAK5_9RHOB|nr:NAD(P)H-dependent oxidoreductase [Jannaschia aquimarina]KIT14734.1 FMN-dependent NADH-azoreductase [Jannaschia aquimarina]SNS76690.1 FMN-dependent NADH-azoreductase [Jannaschia aquimarina]